ncbi:MAG TPA: hypothetical protein VLO07_00890, partial [Thermoanaerobaculia bacterium]|nr:hypothetical protein [Thermoanaerobaculia bacterium]
MRRLGVIGAILVLFLVGTAVPSPAATDRVIEIATILSGTFEGSTPGNELRLDLWPVATDPEHLHDLFLSVTGKYQGQSVRRQGLLRFESQGGDLYLAYIPHFDATMTWTSPKVADFTEEESGAACSLNLTPRGDGFAGETSGATCAFALRGGTGKWSVEIEPGSIRLRSVQSGETLRFK